jgi:hypothetical protein
VTVCEPNVEAGTTKVAEKEPTEVVVTVEGVVVWVTVSYFIVMVELAA